MRIAFVPFCSQQDKVSGKFLLSQDSGVKLYCYMAANMVAMGWDVTMYLPENADSIVVPCKKRPVSWPSPNQLRRLHWHSGFLAYVAQESDLVFTTHDFLAIPLKCFGARVVTEVGIAPGTAWSEQDALYPLAWRASHMIHCNNSRLAEVVRREGVTCPVHIWQFSYDSDVYDAGKVRDVDVLFNVRASATNYSHHMEFCEQLKDCFWVIRMTDPTGYLRQQQCVPSEWYASAPYSREQYIDLLQRSKVVIGLTLGGGGTHSFREAIAAGCIPVALDSPEYTDLLGTDWPFLCRLDNIRETVRRAMREKVPLHIWSAMQDRLLDCSYYRAWHRAKGDILACLR